MNFKMKRYLKSLYLFFLTLGLLACSHSNTEPNEKAPEYTLEIGKEPKVHLQLRSIVLDGERPQPPLFWIKNWSQDGERFFAWLDERFKTELQNNDALKFRVQVPENMSLADFYVWAKNLRPATLKNHPNYSGEIFITVYL